MKENIIVIGIVWNIAWAVANAVFAWLIARGRAHKSEIAEIRGALAALGADMTKKADNSAMDEHVEALAEKEKVDRHEGKLTEHDRRIQRLEGELQHMPSLTLFHDLALALREVQGDLKAITVTLRTNTEMTRRIDDYLRDHDK